MKRIAQFFGLLSLFILAACPASGQQIGKYVPIPAGSDADHAITEINGTADPAQKLALIDKFSSTLGEGDMAIVADDLYVNYYLAQKNYEKTFEYGDKLFALDPDNFSNAVNMVRAASEKGDIDKLMAYGEKVPGILQRFKASAPPSGMEADNWERQKAATLESNKDNIIISSKPFSWEFTGRRTRRSGRHLDALRGTFSRFAVRKSGAGCGCDFVSASTKRAEDAGGGERSFSQRSQQYRNAAIAFGLLQRERRATGQS